VVTIAVPVPGPVAPSNLAASVLTNPTRIRLTWTDNSNNENLFRVFRSVNGGAFTQVATVNRSNFQRTSTGGTVTYTNNGVTAGNTYDYYVIAVNTVPNPDQLSLPSNTVSVTLSGPPAAPAGLAATAFSSTQINLAWTDNAATEAGFTVQRATNAAFNNATTITLNTANQTSYSNTGLTPNTLYYYRVRAFNASGNSAWSNTASARTQAAAGGAPAAPSGLALSAIRAGTFDTLTLNWVDNAANETSFTAQCGTNPTITSNVTTVNNIAANSTSYTRTNVPRGLVLYCRVRAVNAVGNSAWSNVANITTP
jgi:predicted phage tail protein